MSGIRAPDARRVDERETSIEEGIDDRDLDELDVAAVVGVAGPRVTQSATSSGGIDSTTSWPPSCRRTVAVGGSPWRTIVTAIVARSSSTGHTSVDSRPLIRALLPCLNSPTTQTTVSERSTRSRAVDQPRDEVLPALGGSQPPDAVEKLQHGCRLRSGGWLSGRDSAISGHRAGTSLDVGEAEFTLRASPQPSASARLGAFAGEGRAVAGSGGGTPRLSMGYALGIDLGTTYSAAATAQGIVSISSSSVSAPRRSRRWSCSGPTARS